MQLLLWQSIYSKNSFIAFGRKIIPEWAKKLIYSNRILKEAFGQLRRFIIKPVRSPRVYIRKGIHRMEFFKILNERKIDYVLLRWWKDLPEMPPDEDMDILIRDDQRDLLNDLVVFYDNGSGLKCDIYTVSGSNNGSHRNLPYFQINLANALLEKRINYKGAYVPSPQTHFASLAYHAIYHKGSSSGLQGFSTVPANSEQNYSRSLEQLAREIGLEVNIDLQSLNSWLEIQDFTPADDTMSKLVEIKPELEILQKPLFSDIRGGDLLVYIIRERLLEMQFLNQFIDFIEKKFSFDIIDVRLLNEEERKRCTREIRGGKWDEGPYRNSGGPPVAFVVAFDYDPWPLNSLDAKKQTRMTNKNNMIAKYQFRKLINGSAGKNSYNGIHSSDNEHDAWFYISRVGKEYREKIYSQVEKRREVMRKKRVKKLFDRECLENKLWK